MSFKQKKPEPPGSGFDLSEQPVYLPTADFIAVM